MPDPFPPEYTERLVPILMHRLKVAADYLETDLPSIERGEFSRDASMSVLRRLVENVWELWVYPQWKPVNRLWKGPTSQYVEDMAYAIVATWTTVCRELLSSGEKPPYYTTSAAIRVATLRRVGLGQTVEDLSSIERESLSQALLENSPWSPDFAPALWHAWSLGSNIEKIRRKLRKVPEPDTTTRDFCPYCAQMLFGLIQPEEYAYERKRVAKTIGITVAQHYGWLADACAYDAPLSFTAAVAACVQESLPGLLAEREGRCTITRALSPHGAEELLKWSIR